MREAIICRIVDAQEIKISSHDRGKLFLDLNGIYVTFQKTMNFLDRESAFIEKRLHKLNE